MKEKNDGSRIVNAKIDEIGLDVSLRCNPVVRVVFETADGCGCSTSFPPERAVEFMELFQNDDDINLDGGTYVERLSGKYVRLEFDGDLMHGRLVSIGHIIDDKWFSKDDVNSMPG